MVELTSVNSSGQLPSCFELGWGSLPGPSVPDALLHAAEGRDFPSLVPLFEAAPAALPLSPLCCPLHGSGGGPWLLIWPQR